MAIEPQRRLREQRPAGLPLRLLRQGPRHRRRHQLQRRGFVPPQPPHLGILGPVPPRPVHLHLNHRLPVSRRRHAPRPGFHPPLHLHPATEAEDARRFAGVCHQVAQGQTVGMGRRPLRFLPGINTQGPSTSSKTASTCSSPNRPTTSWRPSSRTPPWPACPTSP